MRWKLAVGFVAALAAAGARPLTAQVSPGPLARAHRSLEGALKCTQCHGSGRNAMPARCVGCHRDIGWLAERGRGYHGSAAVKGQRCAACHPDHAGVDFQLIKWPDGSASRFDHRATGWVLEQSHARVECEKCHLGANRVSPAAALAPGGKSSWTGLETRCASCHEDVHRGALGERCVACHDAGKWTVTPGFDHDTTDYPLTGRHADVKCADCHAGARLPLRTDPAGKPVPIYRPVPHQTCASCHQDVHKGAFGADCASCHDTRGFGSINAGRGFDHAKARFPLRGRHAAVKCGACHRDFTTEAGRRPASATCATCHAVDPHAGKATLAGKVVDCASCHSETGFSPGVMTVERHGQTRYPLEGRHATIRCAGCHRKDSDPRQEWGSARVILRPVAGGCVVCHTDPHGGQLAERPDRGECAGCHRPSDWKPSTVDRAAHAKTWLPLEGRHAEIECRACHGEVRPGLEPIRGGASPGRVKFVFTGLEKSCAGCHLDPHGGRYGNAGARPIAGGCAECHDARAFAPAAVDLARHETLGFALAGAHRAVPCASCHREMSRSPARRSAGLVRGGVVARSARLEVAADCAGCHRDRSPHGDQFDSRPDRGRCDGCHGDAAFAPASRFDHDRDAAFKLEGGHARVACAACHRRGTLRDGSTGVIYRPLGGTCEDCHARRP